MRQNQNVETNLNSVSHRYEVTKSLFATILQARAAPVASNKALGPVSNRTFLQ